MIELKNLSKKYDHFLAVDKLNLTIETGEFFGLLGPNGQNPRNRNGYGDLSLSKKGGALF